MRSSIILSAACLLGVSIAAPAPTLSLDNGELAKRVEIQKRDTSAGYFLAFSGLNSATSDSTYLTYKILDIYSPPECADFCNSVSGCVFFNIFNEHDEDGINVHCSLYSLDSGVSSATNSGQYSLDGFHVTNSDSNGYVKPTIYPAYAGWTSTFFNGASVFAQKANPSDPDPYMGYQTITTDDPADCIQACLDKTEFDSEHVVTDGTYQACNFVNFFQVYENNVFSQTQCSFYLKSFGSSSAVNTGWWNQEGDHFTVHGSYGYSLNTPVGNGGIVTVQ